MSKTIKYTVRAGDSLTDIATRFYGVPSEYPKIVDANPDIPSLEVFVGQELTIPAKQVLNPQRSEKDTGKDDVLIQVDGIDYKNTWNFSLKTSIDKAADEYVFEIPWNPEDAQVKESFLPFQYKIVQIFIGGLLRFTGSVINVVPTIGTDKRILKISGYSTCGVLNDCMFPTSKYPLVFKDNTLFDICSFLASAYSIKVLDGVGDNIPFEEVDLKATEKLYKFISKLAMKRGSLLTSDVEGNLIIQRTTDEKATFTFEEGEPDIIGITAEYKGQDAHSTFTGIVDMKDSFISAGDDKVTVKDKFMSDVVSRHFVFELDEIEEGNIQQATEARLRRSLAKRIRYSVVVKGWRDPNGDLWVDNKRMNLFYPSAMIFRTTEFLISAVHLSKTDDKKTTQLTLILPQSYNTDELENVPWLI